MRQHPPGTLRLTRRRSTSEGYGTYHPGVCAEPGCDQPRAKHGFQDGRQRYKRYCSHHYGKLHDRTRAERRKRNPHRLTYEERRKTKLRVDACERCGWNEARCDLHRIIPGGPYTEENTITLCPNCHRVETERARLQDGFGSRSP